MKKIDTSENGYDTDILYKGMSHKFYIWTSSKFPIIGRNTISLAHLTRLMDEGWNIGEEKQLTGTVYGCRMT